MRDELAHDELEVFLVAVEFQTTQELGVILLLVDELPGKPAELENLFHFELLIVVVAHKVVLDAFVNVDE